MTKKKEVCWTCEKMRERCKAISTSENGEVEWMCPQCYRDLRMGKYLYESKKESQNV